jgi:hypothetical protein
MLMPTNKHVHTANRRKLVRYPLLDIYIRSPRTTHGDLFTEAWIFPRLYYSAVGAAYDRMNSLHDI